MSSVRKLVDHVRTYLLFREWYYAAEKWDEQRIRNVALENYMSRALYSETMKKLIERQNRLTRIRELAEERTELFPEAQAKLQAIRYLSKVYR